MKKFVVLTVLFAATLAVHAQDSDDEKDSDEGKKRLFKKENIFIGGTGNVSFFNQQTILGISPYFGYSINKFIDVALQANFNYAGQRFFDGSKARSYTYGPGVFVRLFPVNNIFLQAGYEMNFLNYKEILANNGGSFKGNAKVNSTLIGGGYSNGRFAGEKSVFYFFSILVDIQRNELSPYTTVAQDGSIQLIPVVNGGIQIPIFQGQKRKGGYKKVSGD